MSSRIEVGAGKDKNIIIAGLLWFFLGWGLGAHNYYLGRTNIAVFQFLTAIAGFASIGFGIAFGFFVSSDGFRSPFFGAGIILLLGVTLWWVIDIIYVFKNTTVAFVNNSGASSSIDNLDKLHRLFEKGVISEEEYNRKKQKFLDDI